MNILVSVFDVVVLAGDAHEVFEQSHQVDELAIGLVPDFLAVFLGARQFDELQENLGFLDDSMYQVPVFEDDLGRLVSFVCDSVELPDDIKKVFLTGLEPTEVSFIKLRSADFVLNFLDFLQTFEFLD